MPKKTLSLTRHPAVLALALLAACFDPPVREELRLDFASDGSVAVTSSVELAGAEERTNPAVERRLSELRAALLAGDDAWSGRFAALAAPAERFSWEKRLGALHGVWRSAYLVEPADLPRFFADTALHLRYEVDVEGAVAELAIAPGVASGASRRQRRRVEEALSPWSRNVAVYLSRLADFYRHLNAHPDRAEASLGELFSELLAEDQRARLPPLSGEEEALLDRLGDAMAEVWGVLLIEDGEDHSLDELSRLLYDPFPARFTIRLPSSPVEVEGSFVEAEDGAFVVPGRGLWPALAALEGRWIAPDPLSVYVRHRGKQEGFSLPAFLALERRTVTETELPDAEEVRRALAAELEPDALYRLRWPIDPTAEPRLPWQEGGW